jgi:hypothetical protein
MHVGLDCVRYLKQRFGRNFDYPISDEALLKVANHYSALRKSIDILTFTKSGLNDDDVEASLAEKIYQPIQYDYKLIR